MITLEWNQTYLRGGQRYPLALGKKVARVFESTGSGKRKMDVSASFVTPSDMKRINRAYRGKNKVTDVLSFCLSDNSVKGVRVIEGELLFSYNKAKEQALDRGHSTRDEITFLLVHGLLHIIGYDHEKTKDAKKMFALQTQVLKKLGVDPSVE